MKLPPINGWTALVVVAGIAGVCLLVYLHADPEYVGAYGLAVIGLLAQASKLFPGGGPPPPAGPSVLPVLLAIFALATIESACTPRGIWSATQLLARKIDCAIAHQDLPNARIIAECAIDPADAEDVLAIVGRSRTVSASRAVEGEVRGQLTCGEKR